MVSKIVRAFTMALILGGSAALVAGPADAAVRSAVGKPLQAAQQAASSGNYSTANAKIREAEAVGGITAEERKVINQMKEYVAAKSGNYSAIGGANSANGARAKFASDYNNRRWNEVIAGAETLRKFGAFDARSQQIVAQAYYMKGDYAGCVRYLRGNTGESALSLIRRCAYESGDTATERWALETLVARTGKAEYWGNLLQSAQRTRGLSDHQTLDIYRIKNLTGSMRGAEDYTLLAQLAIQMRSPAEAQAVVEKAMKANVLSGERTVRLLNMAKGQASAEAANLSKTVAAANAAPKGDALLKLSESYWGRGNYKDAIAAAQAGLKKGVTDKNDAQIRLGMAYLGAGQKDAAVRAFNAVSKANANARMVANLWTLYARR